MSKVKVHVRGLQLVMGGVWLLVMVFLWGTRPWKLVFGGVWVTACDGNSRIAGGGDRRRDMTCGMRGGGYKTPRVRLVGG